MFTSIRLSIVIALIYHGLACPNKCTADGWCTTAYCGDDAVYIRESPPYLLSWIMGIVFVGAMVIICIGIGGGLCFIHDKYFRACTRATCLQTVQA